MNCTLHWGQMLLLHLDNLIQGSVLSNPPSLPENGTDEMSASHCIQLHSRCKGQKPSSSMNLPFWVSLVEQTRVEIWKESLLMVQLPRFCMLFPVAECPFSSSSILVDGRLKYVEASSSFFASACSSVLNTR